MIVGEELGNELNDSGAIGVAAEFVEAIITDAMQASGKSGEDLMEFGVEVMRFERSDVLEATGFFLLPQCLDFAGGEGFV